MPKPLVLCILDGYAHNPNPKGNAVHFAKTPTMDKLWANFPHTELCTFGERVGLPKGQMGNSEVGHLNIGAGRVVGQDLDRINKEIEDGSFTENVELRKCLDSISDDQALHLIGLTSKGGVHSSLEHLKAIIRTALKNNVPNIFVHAITDGRDRPPTASPIELAELEEFIANEKASSKSEIQIASIIGRYYAMDRDQRWERTKLAYDLFTKLEADETYDSVAEAIKSKLASGEQDEFLKPATIKSKTKRSAEVKSGDKILFYNFRADRARQIISAFLASRINFQAFETALEPEIFTLTEYDETYPVNVLYPPLLIKNHLGEVLEKNGLSQLRIAETEKYPHVTYFFNGGDEVPSSHEDRFMEPSPKDVPTYDLKPEMSALDVTNTLIAELKKGGTDVAIVNFANCDMVGHTGVFEAAIKAVETVDSCLAQVLACVDKLGGTLLVTADHGNADQMIDYETGEVHTFHTTHPVPFILVDKEKSAVALRDGGALCDIAPTICKLLEIEQPEEMTGQSLF